MTGAYPLDVDADGLTDLAVLRVGQSMLLRGLGDCRFEPANETFGVSPPPAWTTAFSATWEGDAARPTMAFGNYVALDAAGEVASGCADNELYRPDASGTGYGPAIALAPGYCTLSILFSDWDGSGRRDLRVTNDRHYYANGSDQLWRVAPGEAPREYTAADGWVPMQIWGMGIASQDLDGDGLPEVYLTSQGDNKLQTLTAGPTQPAYGDIALARGVTASQPFTGGDALPSTAWHPEFEDVNNDGLMDLFVSKGNVGEVPDYAMRDPSNLSHRPARRHVRRGRRGRGHRVVRQGARRGARRLQRGRAARPHRGEPGCAGAPVAQRRGRYDRCAGADGQLARAAPAASPAATATRSARSSRARWATPSRAGRSRSAAATSAASSAGPTSGSDRRPRHRSG